MLVRKLLTNGEDYEKSLKQRRWAAAGMLAVGLVGLVCYFLLVPGSSLPDFVRGFYMGAASGLCTGGLILLIRSQYLLTHPEAQKEARIREMDERERKIVHTAFETAGGVTFYASAAALFVVLPLSMDAFRALTAVMMLYAVTFIAADIWLSKKL